VDKDESRVRESEVWDVYFGHIPITGIDCANERFVPRGRSEGAMRLSYNGEPS